MKKVFAILFAPLALTIYGLLLLAALIWWVGPLLAFGEHHPFDSILSRAMTIVGLLVLVVLIAALRAWRRRRTNAALVQGMKSASASDREAQLLDQRFAEALATLQDSAKKSGRGGFFRRSALLYELPWYMFIGAPGSGKTTALMNAGLTFPLAGKMGQSPIKGVGGTRNCDWWFTDEAVLIDTAGRYTLQQSDESTDAKAWQTFLQLLRKSRPRQPINGVLLTVNVQDLLQQSPADRKDHAQRLRARIQELHERLGVRPPIYVMVTKCDLLAGFTETFGDLGKEERDQVWGFTLPYDPRGQDAALQEFPSEFAALEKRLRDRLLDGLERELDVPKRAAIFSFPQQFGGFKGLLGGFLEQVFEGGGALEQRPLLRGVYFTSGTQEGTPIDRVLGTLSRTFGVDAKVGALATTKGKSFFLSRLLREVVFAEAHLAGANKQVEARRRLGRRLALAAVALVSLGLLAGWAVSYGRNKAYIESVAARVPDAKAAVDGLPPATNADVTALPQVLDKVYAVPQPEGFDVDAPPLLNRLGLYQGDYLDGGMQIGYHHLLDHALLPRVARRLEERLRAVDRNNLELAYESLKSYLMLYTPEHYDPEALKNFVSLDWDQNLASTLTAEQRANLTAHLDNALSTGAPQAIATMDKALVAQVRDMLVAYPLEYRVFSRLKRANVGADYPEFSVAAAGGPNAALAFERASGQPLSRGIPGLFTRDAYFKAFKGAMGKVISQLADEQEWVLGTPPPPRTAADAAKAVGNGFAVDPEIEQRVRRLYLQEYIKVWDDYLADVRLVKLTDIGRSMEVARVLAAPDSPLAAYLRAVSRETTLVPTAQELAAKKGPSIRINPQISKAKSDLAALVGSQPAAAAGDAGQPLLEAMVDDHFAAIHRLTAGQPAPIDDVLKQFNDLFVQLSAIDAAQKSKSAPPPPPAGGAAAAAAAAMQPEPIKSMLGSLLGASAGQGRTAERAGLSDQLKPVTDFCNRAVAGRFPFAQGARADVLPDDFGQLFGVGGLLDDFYQRNLAALVDTGVSPWAYRPLPDGSKPPGGAALADFERAARIKDAFFRAGGKQPGFKVDVRVVEMSDGMKDLTLDMDGQAFKFTAGNTAAQTLTWPSPRVASQIKLSEGSGTPLGFDGPWALMRLINQFEVQPSSQPERFTVIITVDGKHAKLEFVSGSAINPLRMRELQQFRCPTSL
ncbi:MAG: type VI secretion system membrane subunit TssM [Pelomonas sp.]|nr:type VI secretion system membrane subunit TssM [Roseateles sp.]